MRAVLRRIDQALEALYEPGELETVKKALSLELLGISELTYFTREALPADRQRDLMLDAALARLAKGEPLQYVIGSTPFCGLTFKVDKCVLIPRPETAELVEWVAEESASSGSLLDIGTGSGCIAITLAHRLPAWKVQGWDISDGALEVACENNSLNHTHVTFSKVNVLAEPTIGGLDVIVSNPPYVMESERSVMESTVLDHEPHLALFVKDSDPLVFYRAIARLGLKALNPGGRLYFEINPLKASGMQQMLIETGYHSVETRSDIFGKLRMIKAIL